MARNARRADGDAVSVVPGFLSRPLEVYLRRAGAAPDLHLVDAQAPETAFVGSRPRVWVVTGGVWVGAARPDASRVFPHPPEYALVWQQSYPDEGLRLLLFQRQG